MHRPSRFAAIAIATLVMRPPAANYSLLLGSLNLDGSAISIVGGGAGVPGAHARQRPVPAP